MSYLATRHYSHFSNKETKTERLDTRPKVREQAEGCAGTQAQAVSRQGEQL